MRLRDNGPLWITSTFAVKITKLRAAREKLRRTFTMGQKASSILSRREHDVSKQYSRETSAGIEERETEREMKR